VVGFIVWDFLSISFLELLVRCVIGMVYRFLISLEGYGVCWEAFWFFLFL